MARLHPKDSVRDNYRRVLPKLLRRYFKRGRKLAKSRAAIPDLHRFRIRTKRLRYTAELYEKIYPKPMTKAVKEFREIQDILGKLQDQSLVVDYFERRMPNLKAPARVRDYAGVLQRARHQQKEFRGQFLKRWSRLERSGLEKRMMTAIKSAPKKD